MYNSSDIVTEDIVGSKKSAFDFESKSLHPDSIICEENNG